MHRPRTDLAILDEANVLGVFFEATSADVETVLANNSNARTAHSAATRTLAVALRMRSPHVFVTHVDEVGEVTGRKNDESVEEMRRKRREEVVEREKQRLSLR